MAVVRSAFITAAVIAIFLQKIINALTCFQKNTTPESFIGVRQKNGMKDILGAPDRPVIGKFSVAAHPPEMMVQIRRKDSGRKLLHHALCNKRADLFQRSFQKITGAAENGAGFSGK